MRDFRDAKAMAHTLREALKAKSVSLSHGESLELIAKTLGLHDWNELAALINTQRHAVQEAWAAAAAPSPILPGARVPVLPLRDFVLFPQQVGPIFLGRDKSKRAVEHALASNAPIVAVTQRRAGDDDPGPDALYSIGVTASVINHLALGDGSIKLLVQGLQRVTLSRFIEGEFWSAEVTPLAELRGRMPEASELRRAVLEAYQTYANVDLSSPPQGLMRLAHISDPSTLSDMIVQLLSIGIGRRQELLETADVVVRLLRILELMKGGRQAA
jgi:ATP-dependent Lon protease